MAPLPLRTRCGLTQRPVQPHGCQVRLGAPATSPAHTPAPWMRPREGPSAGVESGALDRGAPRTVASYSRVHPPWRAARVRRETPGPASARTGARSPRGSSLGAPRLRARAPPPPHRGEHSLRRAAGGGLHATGRGARGGRGVRGAGRPGVPREAAAAPPQSRAPRRQRRRLRAPRPAPRRRPGPAAAAAAPCPARPRRPLPGPAAAPAAAAMSKEPRAGREEIMECRVMWEPDSKRSTQMDRFRAVARAACGLALENYNDLYHWSVESYPDFWAEFWKFSGLSSHAL
nr:translation initiation factor IF-2-like [Oryctolagus cuniculus]